MRPPNLFDFDIVVHNSITVRSRNDHWRPYMKEYTVAADDKIVMFNRFIVYTDFGVINWNTNSCYNVKYYCENHNYKNRTSNNYNNNNYHYVKKCFTTDK